MKAPEGRDIPPPTGLIDRFVRRFPATTHGLAGVLLYGVAVATLGLAATPPAIVVTGLLPPLLHSDSWWRWPLMGIVLAAAVFLWGFSLLIVVPAINAVLPTRLRPYSGGYFTAAAVPWYLHNGLLYLVRFTFLPFVTATPIGSLFLRAMGMRMGRRPRITTELFSDVCMITLGDDVTLGGSSTIFCHYGGNGRLVIAPVIIGDRATVGEKATVMGDVIIGEGATVMPHAVVLPGTRIGPRERWGGVPARRITREEWEKTKAEIGIGR